jgi:hypothetical protein
MVKSIPDIESVIIKGEYLIIQSEGREYRFRVRELSGRLSSATEEELLDYEVSASGYGIHWRKIDEDISLVALLEKKAV